MSMSTPSRNSGLSVEALTQRVEDPDRPQVRVQPERLADAEKPLLGTQRAGSGRIPGPPIAPSSTASAACATVSVASGSGGFAAS